MLKLILFRGRDKMGAFDLLPGGTVIGRGDDVAVHVENKMISRRHATVKRTGEGDDSWVLEDLGGANGTWVNGDRVPGGTTRALSPGDLIELGEHVLLFADEGREELEELPTWAAFKSPASKEESTAMVGGQSMDWMRQKTRTRLGTHVSFDAGMHREVELKKESYLIGFTDSCQIRLPGSPLLAKECAKLSYTGRWSVEPLSALAGVKLNGAKIKARSPLNNGDVVTVKGVHITFHTAVVE